MLTHESPHVLEAAPWAKPAAVCYPVTQKRTDLREEEEAALQDAMEVDPRPPGKRVVQVESADGRIVRQETFPMVARDAESVTHRVAVLPQDDPETNALRAASRAPGASTEVVEERDESRTGPQRVLDEGGMEWLMNSEQGKGTFQQWMVGHITSGMVGSK